jgi:hypothetical protein
VGKSVIDPRGARVVAIGELYAGRQDGGDDVSVGVQPAMGTLVGALRKDLGHALAAQAVLAHGGGAGAGPVQAPTIGLAFGGQGRDEHAWAEQGDPFAPQPRPRTDGAVFDGDGVAVESHDPGGDVAGTGLFGLAGSAGIGGVIGAGAPIACGKCVAALRL